MAQHARVYLRLWERCTSLKVILFVALLSLSFTPTPALSQASGIIESAKPAEQVTIRPNVQLVEDNSYFRVSRLEFGQGATAAIEQHDHDCVLIALGEGLTLASRKASIPETLKFGDVRFLPRGAAPEIANARNASSQLILGELKHHWDAEVRTCLDPGNCARPIRMGDAEIGTTTTLFTNGFITGYQHRLDRGGSLSSSYFSAKGKDHLLLVALTDLNADFEGVRQALHPGQTYTSDASMIEVDAEKAEVRWVVIRMLIPKP